MHDRARVALWERQHDGSYASMQGEWALAVRWTPERMQGAHRGAWGFTWEALGPAGEKGGGGELMEEAEVAMMQAEAFARGATRRPSPALGEQAVEKERTSGPALGG